jgi:hypothetical protein
VITPTDTEIAAEPITPDVVISWFRNATTTQYPNAPTKKDVWLLTKTVNQLRQLKYSARELRIIDPDARLDQLTDLDALSDAADIERAFVLHHPLRDLRKYLPELIKVYERNEFDPLVLHRLKKLNEAIRALRQDAAYLFEQSKRGGQDRSWHVYAHILRYPIIQAWKKCGRIQLSNKPDGVLVRVLSYALKAVYGRELPKHTIATELKRSNRRIGLTVHPEP